MSWWTEPPGPRKSAGSHQGLRDAEVGPGEDRHREETDVFDSLDKRRPGELTWILVSIVGLLVLLAIFPCRVGASGSSGLPVPARRAQGSVRFVARPRFVSPGRRVRLRFENRGRGDVGYGEDLLFRARIAGRWVTVSVPHPLSGEVAYSLGPGEMSRWESIRIPADARSGLYRAIKTVTIDGREKRRSATFRVIAR